MKHPLTIFACIAVLAPAVRAEQPDAMMPQLHREFFDIYCVDCHNAKKSEGKLRLDNIPFDVATNVQTADTWQKILGALNAGEMPPQDEVQPLNDEKAQFLEDLSAKMVVARQKLADQGGTIVMRRLNAREYHNTIRDLLGVSIDVSNLPRDGGAGTFDTVGTALFFSPDQFELYLDLGRRALDEVIVAPGTKAPASQVARTEVEHKINKDAEKFGEKLHDTLKRHEAWEAADGKQPPMAFGFENEHRARIESNKARRRLEYYDVYVTWPHKEKGAYLSELHQTHTVRFDESKPSGDYMIRLRVGSPEDSPAERRFIRVDSGIEFNGKVRAGALVGVHHVTGTIADPQVIEIPVTLTKSGPRSFLISEIRPDYHLKRSRSKGIAGPAIWIDWIETEGPFVSEWPPVNHRRIFTSGGGSTAADARAVIQRFAERAFRGKPVAPALLDRLVGIYETHRSAGLPFEDAVKEALAIALASPSFLYIIEPAEDGRRELTNTELAVRLSYFLWSAPPDEQLLAAARDGSLRKPDVLRAQVDRMIDDPRSWEFVTGFNHQWLDMDRLDLFQFDEKEYPDFDPTTKYVAGQEVYHFFDTLMRQNLSVANYLDSDFVVVNGLLAQYYGLEGVRGDAWRKVKLPKDSVRGGMMAMAATLAMGSDGRQTNPVERGAFVLRKLLNDPPPPAPANVPQLSRVDESLSIRERLSLHGKDAQCVHCHRKIDPVGFGLESFDAAGKWRSTATVFIPFEQKGKTKHKKREVEIDTSGKLHNGPAFDNYRELRTILAERTDAFGRGLIEEMLAYSLGRNIGFTDEQLITELHAGLRQDGYGLRSLIHRIVESNAFQTK